MINNKIIVNGILIFSILLNISLGIYSYNKTKQLDSSSNTITNLKKDVERYKDKSFTTDVDQLSNEEKQNLLSEMYNVDIDDDAKIKIATKLFEEYIHINETNWKYNLERSIADKNKLTFEDFKVKNVLVVSTDKNKFTVDITYDIKKSEDSCSDIWNAGTGKDGEGNWILDKNNLVDIIKYEDKYYLQSVYN